MFERFTHETRRAVTLAQEHAVRRGHGQIATVHLLLALAETEAGEVLAEFGVTAEAVEREAEALLRGDGQAVDDDAEVLAALGIDLARIRAAVEAGFGPGALDRETPEFEPHRSFLSRLSRRHRRGVTSRADEVAALRLPRRRKTGHIPFSPAAKKALELSLRECLRLGDASIDTTHCALGLLRADEGAAVAVLARLQVDVGALRSAFEEQGRRSA